MTLQASGPISLDDIRNEFGGLNPLNLSNYYAGGPFVPGGTEGLSGPIPSSGTIAFNDFFGAPVITTDATMVAGNLFGTVGYATDQFGTVNYGTLTPPTIDGNTVFLFETGFASGVFAFAYMLFGTHPQNLFTSLSITGVFKNGGPIKTVVYDPFGSNLDEYTAFMDAPLRTWWVWEIPLNEDDAFAIGNTYDITQV